MRISDWSSDVCSSDLVLRTKNDAAHHLGLALPSGKVAVFERAGTRALLVGEAGIGDTTIDEEVEIALGPAPDVQVRQTIEERIVDQAEADTLALVPGRSEEHPSELQSLMRLSSS